MAHQAQGREVKSSARWQAALGSVAALVALWFGFCVVYALGILWRNSQGPFDSDTGNRLEFWSSFREGMSALLDVERLWRLSSGWFWLVLVIVVAVIIGRWEHRSGAREGEVRWPVGRGWALPVPLLVGLAWAPFDAYEAIGALYGIRLLDIETLGAAFGESLGAPWAGLLTAVGLGLASIFYGFSKPRRLKVWRRLSLALIIGVLSTAAVVRLEEAARREVRERPSAEPRAAEESEGWLRWRQDVLAAFGSGLLPEEIYQVGGEVSAPRPLDTPPPPYPEAVAETDSQALALVGLVVDARGAVREVWTYERVPLGLAESIKEAVTAWRYEPAMLDGKPVAVYYTVAIRFGAGGGPGGVDAPEPAAAKVMASGRSGSLLLEPAESGRGLVVRWTGGSSSCKITPTIVDTWNHLVVTVDRGEPRTSEHLNLAEPCSGDAVAVARRRADGKLDIWQISADEEPETLDAAVAAIRVLLDLCGVGVSFEQSPRIISSAS